ncbi:pyruvate kinase [Halobacteriovorax sp. HLS]|uniref:pyruvate kinase n=1 Tax=Halobacteriovorax sp. HLS TaxID=2234000 RepID=UPI000FD95A40|nr:pyruvate kinase [Halobacteriovorax sp. HLS]
MTKEILCTIGPSSLNFSTINRLEELGVNLFRINMSHTLPEDLPGVIKKLQKFSQKTPICIDSEGAQIRTGNIKGGSVTLRENSIIKISKSLVAGDQYSINLYPLNIFNKIEIGDIISIDFNTVAGQIISKNDEEMSMKIFSGGKIGKNKAVSVDRQIEMEPYTPKDIEAFKIGSELGVKHYALSFAHKKSDIEKMRTMIPEGSKIISKVECHEAIINLDEIIIASDAILIDRGDLSREEPLERIPFLQKKILERAKKYDTTAYVATNLLESMIESPVPTRAEVNDIFNTLNDGATGLVLAAETAIGKYPVKTVEMIRKVMFEFSNINTLEDIIENHQTSTSFLPTPHGGKLNEALVSEKVKEQIPSFNKIEVSYEVLMDAEQICFGTYSPLSGFMTKDELESVLNSYKMPCGNIWTLPILLQRDSSNLQIGQTVSLTDSNGEVYSLLEISDIYRLDLHETAKSWFGTVSTEHPGVKKLLESGDSFIGGKLTLVKRLDSQYREFELTPKQTRQLFNHKGWSRVVGFHSRNVAHRVHEHIQKQALEIANADGLYLSPVIGPKKKGDFTANVILKSYKMMMDFECYPMGKVILGAFATYSRYSGPREAIFTALCRKNMGCSHFIIGRDHTGVGNFYKADANFELFEKLGDLGIKPIFFDPVGYNHEKEIYDTTSTAASISGTQVRESLTKKEKLPNWFMRNIIQDMIISEIDKGNEVFHS